MKITMGRYRHPTEAPGWSERHLVECSSKGCKRYIKITNTEKPRLTLKKVSAILTEYGWKKSGEKVLCDECST